MRKKQYLIAITEDPIIVKDAMELFLNIIYGIAGIALLYYGAEYLVKGGVSVARTLKISPLVIGLTLVAFATSAPELVVSIDSALKGHGDISMGNVVGSNICNIALILGLSATIAPLAVNKKIFALDYPLMLGSAIVLALFYWLNQGVNRIEALFLFAGIIAYTVWSIYSSRKEGGENEETDDAKLYSVPLALLFVVLGIAGLVGGAKLFVNFAVFIAKLCHVSDAVIGLTVVAVGTSLPELATSLVAAVRGETDIAVGNVVGSNIFNVLCILGIAPLISPIQAVGMHMSDMWVMLFVSAILFPFMKTGKKINRYEGIFLFLCFVAYTTWLVLSREKVGI